MRTPICDFVERYAAKGDLRLHMPGHKGISFLGIEGRDITEVEGADVLYSADGIIAESEKNASMLFGSAKTVYSAEGSSLCIRAMVYLAVTYAKSRGVEPLIFAGRNAHKTFLSAVALCDADVDWIYPDRYDSIVSCNISPDALEKKLSSAEKKPVAVYITTPDYLGNLADIKGLSDVCRKFGVLLMVDNAHGAYLRFLPHSRHPLDLGADICCDSAHKTLPVLTGGAYLHISNGAPEHFGKNADFAMSLFASTSPSYLILQSLDRANEYLCGEYKSLLHSTVEKLDELKREISSCGFEIAGDEPAKLAIRAKSYGYRGDELAKLLLEKGIVCEFSDPDFVVMMFTPEILDEGFLRLRAVLTSIERGGEINECSPIPNVAERAMSIKEATFSPAITVPVRESVGKVLASASVSCPPAVPILVCGEKIDTRAVECFEYYGIDFCRVIN